MSKKDLSERDICTKFITPVVLSSGWDLHTQVQEEVTFTAGRIIVRGKLHIRGKAKRADYLLYHKDLQGWRPEAGQKDKNGNLIPDRIYNLKDMDRELVMEMRTRLVAGKVSAFLKATNRFDKTIVFCEDIDHAEWMRRELVNQNADLAAKNSKYVMKITGDDQLGKMELDNFIDPESPYPVIATTSRLMNTGVDAQTCKLIVLDQTINSMTIFKQIIGRGTRINEDYGKFYFTIIDFKKATELFADLDFDGDPVLIYEPDRMIYLCRLMIPMKAVRPSSLNLIFQNLQMVKRGRNRAKSMWLGMSQFMWLPNGFSITVRMVN